MCWLKLTLTDKLVSNLAETERIKGRAEMGKGV